MKTGTRRTAMRANLLNLIKHAGATALSALLLASGASYAQQQVNLTAGPASATLPDGSAVHMWGYGCGAVVSGSTATCTALNTSSTGWSPVVITVPTGQDLQVNLTNNLLFANGNSVPTSLVIVGQLGGGLGDLTQRTTTLPPDHSNAQKLTWPIAGPTSGSPPAQGPRVQSFSTEVAAGTTASLTWKAPRPGTYLIESGTHPSIQGPMGLYGILVVTAAPGTAATGTAYPAVGTTPAITYNADVPLLLSEIDPVQNNAVSTAVNTAGFSETTVWSGLPGGCGNPESSSYNTCYPPAVNYTPLYYLINGVAFNKTNPSASLFSAGSPATATTGKVLVRFVNAGLRMHVPAIVGSQTGSSPGFSLIAEDGNPLPGLPRVQNEVFLAAGKTYDVMINAPAAGGAALPVYDRQLSLSGNGTERDAGMLAYIGINGAGLPTALTAPGTTSAVARADSYNSLITGQTLTVSDPSKGVIANDTNVYGVQVVGVVPGLTLNTNGTFTYTGGPVTFTYCANGTVTGTTCSSGITATVTLGTATIEPPSGITVGAKTFKSKVAGYLNIKPGGVLSALWDLCTPSTTNSCHDNDAAGYPLTVNLASVTPVAGLTLTMDPNGDGGFNASVTSPGTYSFTYKAQNSQGTVSASPATVTLVFPAASNLAVTVLDGTDKTTKITDYRWIIEEDRTFYIDPKNTTNTGATIVPTFGTNFHTSFMPVVATGCTGPLSCASGQSVLGVPAACDVGDGICRTTATQETAVLPGQVTLDPTMRYYLSILPGDAATPFGATNLSADCTNGVANAKNPSACGHGMGGVPIPFPGANGTPPSVTVLAQPTLKTFCDGV